LGPIIFTIADPSIATIRVNSIDIVDILKAGTTTITATQAGNDNYNPVSATATLTVNKAAQTITGLSDITKTYGDADFDLSATASSGLPVSYTSSNTAVATINGNTVHIVGAGAAVITASQAGNNNYDAAAPVTVTLTVNKAVQTISGLIDITKPTAMLISI